MLIFVKFAKAEGKGICFYWTDFGHTGCFWYFVFLAVSFSSNASICDDDQLSTNKYDVVKQ